MTLNEIRRRPTLPGRFQPSTISVLRLNFCVRDGNRWIPQAIVTGKEQGSRPLLPPFFLRRIGHTTASRLPLKDFASGFAPSKPHRLVSLPLSDQDSFRSPSHSLTNFLRGFGSGLRFRFPPLAFARFRSPIAYSLLPIASSLPRSSPRPISIIKLHTLPHFHR